MKPPLRKSRSIFFIVTAFALLLIVIGGASVAAAYNYPMQGSMSWSFVKGNNPNQSYFSITISVSAKSAAVTPSQVNVAFSSSYNGSIYFLHSCALYRISGQTYTSCSFNTPFKGGGEYVFAATFTDTTGKLVAITIIDPHAEPEWK